MKALKTFKNEWYVLLIAIAPLIISGIIWNDVPDTVPVHFNIDGEADRYGAKSELLLLIPGINIGIYLLLLFLPAIDPKKNIDSTQKAIKAIRIITVVFMDIVYAVTIGIAMGYELNISTYIFVSMGGLFFVLGNYMNSIKPNYFIGIRTPWTLESPEVWKKTHRLSSKLWMFGGVLMMGSPFIDLPGALGMNLTLILIVPLALIPLVYSYIVYNQLQKTEEA